MSGDREVQRTMLELLNQLDGFSSDDRIKVCYSYIHVTIVIREHIIDVEFFFLLLFCCYTWLLIDFKVQ